MRCPPGPINYSASLGLTWRHFFRIWQDPLNFTLELARNYGDIVFFRVFWYRAYQINHPDMIYEVMVRKAKNFVKLSRPLAALRYFAGDGIINQQGERWRLNRRVLQPGFDVSCGARLANIGLEEVDEMLARWERRSEVFINDEMNRLVVRSLARWLFGYHAQAESDELVNATVDLSLRVRGEMVKPFRLPNWLALLNRRRTRPLYPALETLLREIIAARRKEGELGDDLLGIMLGAAHKSASGDFTDELIINELVSQLFAGHHTTGSALTWTLYLLHKHPAVKDRVQAEISTVLGARLPTAADLPKLNITEMVLKESMRLYPPAWALFCRQAAKDVQIGDYLLPAGSLVFIYPWVVHRDSRYFPDAERFDPDRFDSDRAVQWPPGAYMPFGIGPHVCIGGRVANVMLSILLPAILQRCVMSLPAGALDPELEPLMSLRPRGDIRMHVQVDREMTRAI